MENKAWLWRRRSSEKTIITTNRINMTLNRIDEELPMENEVRPVKPVRNLNEQLASVLLDSRGKDDTATEIEKPGQEAIAGVGQEKATQDETICLKELDEARIQGVVETEKSSYSDAALKQCMQQLSSLREEQEQKIEDAVKKASSEFEKVKKKLEEKLLETSKRLANLANENANMGKALVFKEKMVEELHHRMAQSVAEFDVLMARLDSAEKENAFLKYEFCVLEKELEIRSEEMEYNRRSADALQRQHLEGVKKITKLEAECQRLRVLMRKRLPGPVASAKMRSEFEMPRRDQTEVRRKPNPTTRDLILRETAKDKPAEIPVENINFLIEQLRSIEEENKILKDVMAKKNAELQSSGIMFSRTASRLSQAESRLTQLSGSQTNDFSSEPTEGFDNSSDEGVCASGSWANALISELEHFKERKLRSQLEQRKAIEDSDMSLMDDFVEMEKLAIVSVETPSGFRKHLPSSGMELVPVEQGHSCCNDMKPEIQSKDVAVDESFDWLQEVLNAICKQQQISKRSTVELLEDIKIALGYIDHIDTKEVDTTEISSSPPESDIRCYITWKSPNTTFTSDSVHESSTIDSPVKETLQGIVASAHDQNIAFVKENIRGNLEEENKNLKDKLKTMESEKSDLKARLQSATNRTEDLMMRLREQEQSVEGLKAELETLKESKGMMEDQIENQKSINEDLDTQLTVARAKLNAALQKFASLEVELEDKSNCCDELESTCLELQLQLESVANKETTNYCANDERKQPQNGWEITAASVKLAECQETILNLGKQLKALASPREAALFDKVFSASNEPTATIKATNLNKRFSLRDQMLAEDSAKAIILRSPIEDTGKPSLNNSYDASGFHPNALITSTPEEHLGSKHKVGNIAAGPLAIVPSKKHGTGFLKRLLMRKKKGSNKKSRLVAKV